MFISLIERLHNVSMRCDDLNLCANTIRVLVIVVVIVFVCAWEMPRVRGFIGISLSLCCRRCRPSANLVSFFVSVVSVVKVRARSLIVADEFVRLRCQFVL